MGAALAALGFGLGGIVMAQGALAPLNRWLSDAGASIPVEPSLARLVGLPSWLGALAGLGSVALLLWRFPPLNREPGPWPWPVTGSALGLLGVLAVNSLIATAGIAVGGALAARALDRPGQDQ